MVNVIPLVTHNFNMMNGYGGEPSGQEYHHYYGPNGEEHSGPGPSFSGRMSGQFPAMSYGYPRSYTVVGMMERGRVIGIDPEVSTPGVSHLPTPILQELSSVYGHLGNARFSVSCSDGRFSIQAAVLPPPLPPPPPQRRPAYFEGGRGGSYGGGRRGGYGRHRKGRRDRQPDFEDVDDEDEDDEDEIVIEIPMETYRKLQEQKRRNGRKPDIIIDDSPNVYEGHPMSGYNPHQKRSYQNNNSNPNPKPKPSTPMPTRNSFPNNVYSNADDPNAHYVPDDQGELVQQYRRQQRARTGRKDDGDNYEPVEMQTGRSKFSQVKGRHSDGAGTDMGAPPDSYIMDKYLKTYNA